jgi:2,5-diketo-D-gluconate reductase B
MSILYKGVNQRGFGTWPLRGGEARAAIESALDVGYRAIDTAQMYENEAEVGAAVSASGLQRKDVCITTKVHPDNFAEGTFLASVETSVKKLGGPPDVLLLHWPPAGGDVVPGLRLLQQALDRGLVSSIGISNYTIAMMETASKILDAPIAANQVEMHPLIDQSRLLAAASRLGIPVSSYCSIAKGKVMDQPELAEIGAFHGKTAAQVALRWLLQKGINPIAMSTKRRNQEANFDVMDFVLSNVQMARIDALAARVNARIVTHTPWVPEWDA